MLLRPQFIKVWKFTFVQNIPILFPEEIESRPPQFPFLLHSCLQDISRTIYLLTLGPFYQLCVIFSLYLLDMRFVCQFMVASVQKKNIPQAFGGLITVRFNVWLDTRNIIHGVALTQSLNRKIQNLYYNIVQCHLSLVQKLFVI